jgi:hypothetical protein
VTITKSITIEGTGTLAGIINGGTHGIDISAGVNDVVVLRNLSLHGFAGIGVGFFGIRIRNAGEVYIENCTIQNHSGDGIEIAPNTAGLAQKVFIRNTRILNNTGKGIEIIPANGATVKLMVENSDVSGNGSNGIDVTGNNNSAAIYNSKITHNGLTGAQVQLTSSTLFIGGSLIAHNQTGVNSGLAGQTPVTRLSGNMIVGNTANA